MISIDYSLIIVILNFVLLLIVLNKILYKPIKKFLEERQQTIASDLDDAKASRTEAEKLVEKKGNELKQSAEEIRKMKGAATSDAEGKARDIVKNAKEQEKRILQDTEHQLKTEKVKVMGDIEDELAEMVAELSSKFLSEKLDESKDKELIKRIISERGNK